MEQNGQQSSQLDAIIEAATITRLEDGRAINAERLQDALKLTGATLEVSGEGRARAASVRVGDGQAVPLTAFIGDSLASFADWLGEDVRPGAARVAGQSAGGGDRARDGTMEKIIRSKRASGSYII